MSRQQTIQALAERLESIQRPHPVRVAIDGIDAAGKTTLADELASALAAAGRAVIRASVDGFQRPRAERYRRRDTSPLGYYEDAFDYPALQAALLLPLGPGGNRLYRRAVFDVRHDAPLRAPTETAPYDALLLVDGVFLLRPELVDLWDYTIFVRLDFEMGLRRALERDLPVFGSSEVIQQRYLQRYYPGQRLYFERAMPEQRADAIVDNSEASHPKLIFLASTKNTGAL
jgi:uridine kinase